MDAPHMRLDTQSQPGPHVLPYLPRVTLEIVRGRARRLLRRVAPPVFLIGRAIDCDLVLADEQFPEAYAYVYVSTEGVNVRHLGAPPELRVNGRIVESVSLDDGDRLEMGCYEFQINIQVEDPRGGGIRAHDDDYATIPYDVLGLDAAAGQVRHLLAEIRQALHVRPLDLHIFGGPQAGQRQQLRELARRPLAGFVTRRASA
ncbi:MAG TPA: FHA domain-containing protein [Pirellulaceae bacterium]|nr:FHA domain-containing protein [Pirellulaceae bacterium]